MEFKIPKSFKLFGHTIKIEFDKELIETAEAVGEAHFKKNLIKLQTTNNINRPKEHLEETFVHELTHFILYNMNENELTNNEKFIYVFSRLLHQALKTMEY